MKITIARIRSGIKYEKPLTTPLDSFYELYRLFILRNSQYQYGYYNFGYGKPPKRDIEAIKGSDVIIIPSENEFHYHVENFIRPSHLEKSNNHIEKMKPYLDGTHLILFCSERADTSNLYQDRTFKGVNFSGISVIDEVDFPSNIHGLKYYNTIEFMDNPIWELCNNEPFRLFAYWGTDKSNKLPWTEERDTRHITLKQIFKSDIDSYFIGYYKNFKADLKGIRDMYSILSILKSTKSTICFNWLDQTATTARYHEAIACDMIPFAWGDYDKTGTLVKDEWQRVLTFDELYDKIKLLENDTFFNEKLLTIKNSYLENLPSREEYYEMFESKLKGIL